MTTKLHDAKHIDTKSSDTIMGGVWGGEPAPDAWEKGYTAGYDRALKHMRLVGCRCTDASCAVCLTADRLEDVSRDHS